MAVVGIDLGTTNTVVGIVKDGRAMTIRDGDGEYLIPSVVSFHSSGTVLVGRAAKERRTVDAANTIYSIKRLIGRSWNSDEVGRARSRFPFEMREGPGQAALVVARGETFTLPEISAFVLRHAKALAEKTLGEPVDRAVITVPANFNDLQRAATKVAGRVAGLEVLRILNEPTAAALAYGYGRSKGERITIYDFGGGTFDVTILDLSGNVFEVLATAGNTFLGGDDIDLAIAEKMADACKERYGIDARRDGQVFERLRYYAEKLKVELSTSLSSTIEVPDVGRGPGGKALQLSFTQSRAELEDLARPTVEQTFEVCADALSVARLTPQDLDQIVLVGGSTRLPIVRARVAEYFARAPLDRINPDEVVAIGAAIQANALTGAERRRSVIPRPPMPAARSLEESVATRLPRDKSQPPPHPNVRRTSTGGTGQFGMPRPAAYRPNDTARAGTGAAERRPPPARKGGTLGGVGAPLPVKPDTEAVDDAAWGRFSSKPAAPPGAALTPVEHSEDEEPTRVQISPSVQLPPMAFPMPSEAPQVDEQPPRVGAPPEILAAARALFDEDEFGIDTGVKPRAVAPAPKEPEKEKAPFSPTPAAAPLSQFKKTMLGGVSPARAAPALAPPAPPPPVPQTPFSTAMPASRQLEVKEPRVERPVIPLLVDVTPLSLCVETVGGFRDIVIARNTPVPCEQSRTFVTARDNQQIVLVRVGQGETERFADNVVLGELELSGLRAAPRGEAQFVVTFTLDTDGMLEVRARDPETGNAATARLRLVGLPDQTEVSQMTQRNLRHPAP